MCGDVCKTKNIMVTVQENGIIRNSNGYLIGRLSSEIDFDSEHIQEENKENEDGQQT